MQSEIVAMLTGEDSPEATMLVRRASGQFDFARIDVRLAVAACAAAKWDRPGAYTDKPS